MKIRIALTALGISTFYLLSAQERSLEIVSPAGGIDQAKSISLEWTAGELATETVYTNSAMITQGFHQPVLRAIRQIDLEQVEVDNNFQVFPNPVESVLEVKLPSMEVSETVELRLLDMEGQLLLRQVVPANQGIDQIDMNRFAPGKYLLQCDRKSTSKITTFKIIKS